MQKDTRNAIERATQRARKLLEEDFATQLEGDFDVHRDGTVAAKAGSHLSGRQSLQRERIVAAIEHKRAAGMSAAEAAHDYVRDTAFTTLNRFVALKMLEARELVQECITKGEQSAGYREFCGLAQGLPLLPDSAGYRLYIESLFDELSTEVKVLFDRRDPSSALWPKRATFGQLLEILNGTELARVWGEDETIGWVYQFFNGQDERRKMREESQAPRNSRELAVRNQFFTPRYVVQFLTDNTLGRIWYEMRGTKTGLAEKCEYMVRKPDEEVAPRTKKDPRDLRVLDPACGSGHFLLYAFDLLLAIYQEAYADSQSPKSAVTGKTLAEDFPSLNALRKAIPGLILAHNLHGVDIDPRCTQIAQLALWMRAQKAFSEFGIGRADRAQIRRSNIVVAEPLVADDQIAKEFVAKLGDAELERVFTSLVESLSLAGDLGLLLRVEQLVTRQGKQDQTKDLFAPSEERIRAALARFVVEEGGRTTTRRRLFADDAVQGVGLLCVAENRFDAVLMNPPFGLHTERSDSHQRTGFKRTWQDIYSAFFERAIELSVDNGRTGALSPKSFYHAKKFRGLRDLLRDKDASLELTVDIGGGVLDAAVEVCCSVIRAGESGSPSRFLNLSMSDRGSIDSNLRTAVRKACGDAPDDGWIAVDTKSASALPNQMYPYRFPPTLLRLFHTCDPFAPRYGRAAVGLTTFDNVRFIRAWWEVAETGLKEKHWIPVALGGGWAPFALSALGVIKWRQDAREMQANELLHYSTTARTTQSRSLWFRRGLTFSKISTLGFSCQAWAAGGVFTGVGLYIDCADGDYDKWLAFFNARATCQLLSLYSADRHWLTNNVASLPIPSELPTELSTLGSKARDLMECRWALEETSPSFRGVGCEMTEGNARTFDALVASINEAVDAAYGFDSQAKQFLEENGLYKVPACDEGVASRTERLHHYALGRSFGRWQSPTAQPEKGIHLNEVAVGDLALCESPSPSGILTDDEGSQFDICTRVVSILNATVASPQSKSSAGDELTEASGCRAWLRRTAFEEHIERYTAVGRKAPIYWQLATPSAGYSAWLYIHEFSKDTLFRLQNDYAGPKLAHEERRLESLTNELRDKASPAQRKELAAQEVFVEELRAFLEEVKRVAPLWNPNLDDGVIINFAPLWRLVPQNKSWQKELKSTWDALCEGTYDWAHVAMHLWPERVVPKCSKDRSLAIAHGLEDLFWVQGSDGKWTARKTPVRPVDELVRDRTSPAVKSALKSLLEAPTAIGKNAGHRRRKAAAAADGRLA